MVKSLVLALHRWLGLTIALALIVTGLTGAVLPYQREIGHWLAPEVWKVQAPHPGAVPLSGLALARRVEAETGGSVSYVPLSPAPDRAQAIYVSPRPGGPPVEREVVFANPYTGDITAQVRFADLRDGAVNVMPFILLFHYSLAAGEWGRRILGIAALLWAGVALAGLLLTLRRRGAASAPRVRWWRGERSARPRSLRSATNMHVLHRRIGFWLWPLMLVFAWSAVAFNLDGVHRPVQRFLGAEGLYRPVDNPRPAAGTPMSPAQALAVGQQLMMHEAERLGFTIKKPEALTFDPFGGTIGYYALTSLDGPAGNGSTAVWFDQVSGRQLAFRAPFGDTAADGLDKTFRMLHTAGMFGWPYRVIISLFGLLTAASAFFGVAIWLRKPMIRRVFAGRSR